MLDLRKKNRLRPAFKPTCKPRSAKASFFLKKKSRQNMYRYKKKEKIKQKQKKRLIRTFPRDRHGLSPTKHKLDYEF